MGEGAYSPMRALSLSLTLVAALSGPVSAEEPNSRIFPEDRIERAAFLFGIAAYVSVNCQTIHPDWRVMRIAIAANNVREEDLKKPPLADLSKKQVEGWLKAPATSSCRLIDTMFGAAGTLVPGLVLPGGPD
jgi:hypothetical protein